MVDRGEAGPRGADEERRRHERLRQHDCQRGEGDRDPQRLEGLAEEPIAAEQQEQSQAGDGGRQHDREVDHGFEEGGAAKATPREDERQREPDHDAQDEADRRREQAQGERVHDDREPGDLDERTGRDRTRHEHDDRQAEGDAGQRRQSLERPAEPGSGGSAWGSERGRSHSRLRRAV